MNEYMETIQNLKNELKTIDDVDDLVAWVERAGDFNSKTGLFFVKYYNENKELEEVVKYMDISDNYLCYLTTKADVLDIFLFIDVDEIIEIENKTNPIIDYAVDEIDRILKPNELENIYYYDKDDLVAEFLELNCISSELHNFIDADFLYNEEAMDDISTKYHGGLIRDYNLINY